MNIQGKSNHQGILFPLVSFFPISDINKEESNSCVQPVHAHTFSTWLSELRNLNHKLRSIEQKLNK